VNVDPRKDGADGVEIALLSERRSSKIEVGGDRAVTLGAKLDADRAERNSRERRKMRQEESLLLGGGGDPRGGGVRSFERGNSNEMSTPMRPSRGASTIATATGPTRPSTSGGRRPVVRPVAAAIHLASFLSRSFPRTAEPAASTSRREPAGRTWIGNSKDASWPDGTSSVTITQTS
jgi:hypothetical protein